MFYALIVLAAAARFLPHPPNVACVGALGLLAGCHLAGRRAWVVPVAVMLGSDIIGQWFRLPGVGFYSPVVMAGVYAGMLASVPAGRWLRGRNRFTDRTFAALIASTLFFLVSNLAVWAGGWYAPTPTGLVTCFVAALPFFGFTLIGDQVFAHLLLGLPNLSPVRASSKDGRTVVAAA